MDTFDTRTIGRRAGAVLAATLLAGAALAVAAPPASAGQQVPPVAWQSCPAYSEETLRMMAPQERQAQLRELLGRLQCGTVSVPLDYRIPHGQQITVALTRLKARDQAHRLGSMALNPGGPGGSGYLMPVDVLMRGDSTAGLNEHYDLIGFDPRGVGYSTKVNCAPGERVEAPAPGPLTEAAARRIYDAQVAELRACGRSDPAFLGRLTTANVARDLDRIRAGLGESRLHFLGISWGTWLGVVYRTLFPQQVGRMFLDSVAIPRFDIPAFEKGRLEAGERNAAVRLTAWLAANNDTYGLGATADEVRATIIALRASYDANPRRFTDLEEPIDGRFIATAAAQSAPVWPLVGQILKELREATGPTAPPTVKEVLGDDGPGQAPPADAPERQNRTMNKAAFCNEDPSRADFDTAWATYQRNLAQNPLTGRTLRFSAGCAGWPLPVQAFRIKPGGGSLVLSGHRWETPSPYEWTLQTRTIVGGRVYTVDDDVHGSALRECTGDIIGFFDTGRIDGGCTGVPVPSGPVAVARTFDAV
ncbi:tripeptidyl aminopeptidase [Virgisporangium aliadipatigenens]|uniref:Tripeptidyl aminopeptidase n=1 Tax=Virgisporangium aliadipatigenens TaxID=741659 RepID=A0A8J3YV31_9ACTN|nr:alpha/beta hydrolase [Virgisporangium aliadipatigenens]GIJ50385.1 tripeptidyl aminopeptidase [Virgisporangium aliadipatigenens]